MNNKPLADMTSVEKAVYRYYNGGYDEIEESVLAREYIDCLEEQQELSKPHTKEWLESLPQFKRGPFWLSASVGDVTIFVYDGDGSWQLVVNKFKADGVEYVNNLFIPIPKTRGNVLALLKAFEGDTPSPPAT